MVGREDEHTRSGRTGSGPAPAPVGWRAPRVPESSRSVTPAASTRWHAHPAGRRVHPHAAGRRVWWPLYALIPILVVFAVDLYGLLDQRRVNAMLARGELTLVAERDTARGRLARAYRLHTGGRLEEALAAYGTVAPDAEPDLRSVQRFNLGNLYLERAVELERKDEIQPAMSLVELAKQNYREILARDSHHWDARYNLSRALEMLPDVGAVDFEDEFNPERSPQAPQASRSYEGLP